MESIHQSLVGDGIAVIDFMNSFKTIQNLEPIEEKEIDGIRFHIARSYHLGVITKMITFRDSAQDYQFEEKVNAFLLEDFKDFFKRAGLEIVSTYGNYKLVFFDENESDRLIFVLKKK